jgi:hypothetical protein
MTAMSINGSVVSVVATWGTNTGGDVGDIVIAKGQSAGNGMPKADYCDAH